MTKLLGLAFISSLCFAGCTSSGDDSSTAAIDNQPVTGMVSGQPWTYTTGATDAFLSKDGDNFFASFYAAPYSCGQSEPSGPSLIVAVPKTTGDFPMSLMRNMTFVNGSDNKIAVNGHVRVDSVTATKVTGGLVGDFDDANNVNGTFTLTVCPDEN